LKALPKADGDLDRQSGSHADELRELRKRDRERVIELDLTNEKLQAEIAEREKAEAALRLSQKMEAIGRLTGVIAHDFNNILGLIIGYSELMQGELDENQRLSRDLREIRKAADRGSLMTRQLLMFSRADAIPATINVNDALREFEALLRQAAVGTELSLDLTEPLDPVRIEPGQIEQIVMNLVLNARDAMPEGGKIEVCTAGDAGDEYVHLSVSDEGAGISRDAAEHIFEPFFTTKPREAGTGLGLYGVYGIVNGIGGCITVDSEPGAGTRFDISLPRAGGSTTS
jgi:signal transduction histidine kinase